MSITDTDEPLIEGINEIEVMSYQRLSVVGGR